MLPDTMYEFRIFRDPKDRNKFYVEITTEKNHVIKKDGGEVYSIQVSGAYLNQHGCPIMISEKQMIFENND